MVPIHNHRAAEGWYKSDTPEECETAKPRKGKPEKTSVKLINAREAAEVVRVHSAEKQLLMQNNPSKSNVAETQDAGVHTGTHRPHNGSARVAHMEMHKLNRVLTGIKLNTNEAEIVSKRLSKITLLLLELAPHMYKNRDPNNGPVFSVKETESRGFSKTMKNKSSNSWSAFAYDKNDDYKSSYSDKDNVEKECEIIHISSKNAAKKGNYKISQEEKCRYNSSERQ